MRELEVRSGALRIALRRMTSVETLADNTVGGPRAQAILAEDEHTRLIRSPLTGVWYDSPSPGAPPFVRIGDLVEVGTLVGVIETMKIFNEVASDASGRVCQIHVHAGELVQVNAPIIALDPSEGPISSEAFDQ
ncbi:MAG: accB [Chloroflexi bacterium]|nr:accB [Chloroflexota bacterium]